MVKIALKNGKTEVNQRAAHLLLEGGYTSFDRGCTEWGTVSKYDSNFIGDRIGDIVISYQNGRIDTVPLVFGYTLWFYNVWDCDMEPFCSDAQLAESLREALHLYGAYERQKTCFLDIRLADEAVEWICVKSYKSKKSKPVFRCAYLHSGGEEIRSEGEDGRLIYSPQQPFFQTKTIETFGAVPEKTAKLISSLRFALYTFEEDYSKVYQSKAPGRLKFSGDTLAELATDVLYHNSRQMLEKVDGNGFFHTSSKGTYSWIYDGFGAYRAMDSYYDCIYSRDAGRAVMSLLLMGEIQKAKDAVRCINGYMMYYPENNLYISGQKVRGHYSVIPNKPLIYSTVLTSAGWPTQFTREKFGDGYRNLGNLETDGHGLMMMANYLLWKSLDRDTVWLEENYRYIKEAAEFLVWQHDSDLLFTKNGLLYGETEAAMNGYTLYANIPCMLGLRGYSEMARALGDTDAAERWNRCADSIESAVGKQLSENGKWKDYGFYHDPVLTMCFDMFGYDFGQNMPPEWLGYSENGYPKNMYRYLKNSYVGARGVGYDHNMITQSAMLLNRPKDYGQLIGNLIKICYAPRLPDPFICPEGVTVRPREGVYRRQGDLGNLVQQAETIKTLYMCAGLSLNNSDAVVLAPRLPYGWSVEYDNVPIPACYDEGKQVYLNGKISFNRENHSYDVNLVPSSSKIKIRCNMSFQRG